MLSGIFGVSYASELAVLVVRRRLGWLGWIVFVLAPVAAALR